jgi:hypothetical protein
MKGHIASLLYEIISFVGIRIHPVVSSEQMPALGYTAAGAALNNV